MNHSDWVQFASIMSWIWRTIEWAIVKGLYFLCQGAENVIDSIFKVTELLNDGVVGKYYHAVQAIAWVVLAVMLVWIGIRYIIGKEVNLKNNLIQLVLGACFLVGGAGVIDWGLQVVTGTFQDTKAVVSGKDSTLKTSLSFNIIKDNTADLMYVAENHQWNTLLNNANKKEKEAKKNQLSSDVFMNMDLTEVLEDKQLTDIKNFKGSDNEKASKALGQEIIGTDDKGKYQTKDVDNGWFSLFKEGYYRYGARFMPMIIGLIVMLCAFLLTAFIIVTNILDLVFVKILSPIMAVSDIDTGQRLKTTAMEAFKSLVVIACSGISLGIFSRYFTWVGQQDLGVVPYAVLLLAGLKVCIDGSHVFGKLLGVDVGLQDGWKMAMGAYAGAKGMASAGKAVSNVATGVANGTSKTIQGISKKIDNNTLDTIHDRQSNENKDSSGLGISQPSNASFDMLHNQNTDMNNERNQEGNDTLSSISKEEGDQNQSSMNHGNENSSMVNGDQNLQGELSKDGDKHSAYTQDSSSQSVNENEEQNASQSVDEQANLEQQEMNQVGNDHTVEEDSMLQEQQEQSLEGIASHQEENEIIENDTLDSIHDNENVGAEDGEMSGNEIDNNTLDSIHGAGTSTELEDGGMNGSEVDNSTLDSIHEAGASTGVEEEGINGNPVDNSTLDPLNGVDSSREFEGDTPEDSIQNSTLENAQHEAMTPALEKMEASNSSSFDDKERRIHSVNSNELETPSIHNQEMESNVLESNNISTSQQDITNNESVAKKENILSEVNSYSELDLTKPIYKTREDFERSKIDLRTPNPELMRKQRIRKLEDEIDKMMNVNRKGDPLNE